MLSAHAEASLDLVGQDDNLSSPVSLGRLAYPIYPYIRGLRHQWELITQ